jgi:hypothetical protein
MFSANAEFLRQSQIERLRSLSHEARLRLFIEHSARMKRLSEAGAAMREAKNPILGANRQTPSPDENQAQ